MKYKDENDNWVDITLPSLDSMPVGTEVDFDGDVDDIPVGWEETTNPESYSTIEVKTNKVWIDGKPIYRRVWTGNTPTSSTVIDTIANFDKAINIYGTYKDNYSNFTPIQVYGSTGCIPQVNADGRVYLTPKTDGDKNKPYLLIIEYTKTTD